MELLKSLRTVNLAIFIAELDSHRYDVLQEKNAWLFKLFKLGSNDVSQVHFAALVIDVDRDTTQVLRDDLCRHNPDRFQHVSIRGARVAFKLE